MEKYIYQVEVEFTTTGVMYIEARDEAEAKGIADVLADAGAGDVDMDIGGGEGRATSVNGKTPDDPRAASSAKANKIAYEEINADM